MAIDATGINLSGFGYQTVETITAATLTTDINDNGKVLNFTHATPVVTLHATDVGTVLTFRVGANPQVLTISPDANDRISGVDLATSENKDLIFTNQPIGSYVTLVADGSDGWLISAVSGAVTIES
ncbi:MAG: hypothetical protein M0R80_17450 [Proteobacteria bacterium]|jgi:hypothetical protein|nr:hypothetical protein [Pseudomonadota bacterium]